MALDVARELAILLTVAFAGYLVATFSRQSVAIGEILVGLAVGPSLLNLVQPTEFVEALALIGALVLLFAVGLEHRFEDIFRGRYAVIAIAGVVVPWVGGFGLAALWGYPTASAVFIGTTLTATSIAITAVVLKEMGKLDSEVGKAILGAAVIDDVLGLVALAVTLQIAQTGTVELPGVGWLLLKAAALIVIGGLGGIRVLTPLLRRMGESSVGKRHPESIFLLALNIAFVYALVAELLGISGIVGAFLAGVVLHPSAAKGAVSFHVSAETLTTVFAGIFFVSLGVLIDLRQVAWAVVPFVLLLTLVAMATKVFGCALPARFLGMSRKDSLLVGAGMAPRGEVALIVAVLGLQAAAIGQDVYTAVVMMSLLTTLLTPPILRWLARPAAQGASAG